MFTARYELIPYIKQITFRLQKFKKLRLSCWTAYILQDDTRSLQYQIYKVIKKMNGKIGGGPCGTHFSSGFRVETSRGSYQASTATSCRSFSLQVKYPQRKTENSFHPVQRLRMCGAYLLSLAHLHDG